MSYEVIRDYRTKVTLGVRRLGDAAFVPKCTDNHDWLEFLAWNAVQTPPLDIADGVVTLGERQLQRAAELSISVKSYIEKRYPDYKQRSFSHVRITATGATADLIDSVWTWITSVIAYYYQKEDAIVMADDISEVDAVSWDLTQFDETDPVITLRDVLGISSSSSA